MSQGRGFLGRRNLETIRRTGACVLGLMLSGSGLLYALLYGQSAPPAAKQGSKEVALQVIVVSTPELASQVLEKLKAGSDFATLAKEKSIDPTADTGGFTGRMDLATLRPELRDALKGVASGQLSPITRIPSGYAILKVIPPEEAEKTSCLERGSQRSPPTEACCTHRAFPVYLKRKKLCCGFLRSRAGNKIPC